MKKSLVALAALAATSAFAQSTVTLSGTFDLSLQNAKNDATSATTMLKNGMASSRIQFAGTEDMGQGMKANFTCDTDLSPAGGLGYNTATINTAGDSASSTAATATASLCNRTGLVGVAGGFGRIDLGGDYTPSFRVMGIADPFGTNGVANWGNLAFQIAKGGLVDADVSSTFEASAAAGTGGVSLSTPMHATSTSASAGGAIGATTVSSVNTTRANNTVTYTSPTFNGVHVAVMYIVDGVAGNATTGKLGAGNSVRVRYDAGPLSLAVGAQKVKHALTYGNAQVETVGDITTSIFAASYDLGMAKVSFGWKTQKLQGLKGTDSIVGLWVPMGAGTIRASFAQKAVDTADGTGEFGGKQVGLGYAYALSKRTDAYAHYARVTNDTNAQYGILTPTAGRSANAYQVGVRHAF